MFEGIPNYPDTSRWWQIIDKFKVNTFYTAPTAIRALMREGDGPVKKTSRKSLEIIRNSRENQLIQKHGCGIIKLLEILNVQLLILGGKLKLVEF